MKAVSIAFLLFLSFSHSVMSQANIHGRVVNAEGHPLPYVSVNLLKDSTLVSGAISNEAGWFKINAALITGVHYTLRLSLVGYETGDIGFVYPDTASISRLQLLKKAEMLGGVTVEAKKPLVTRRADRYIVNVEDSYLANGQSGLDVLRRSPGLWVGTDGGIRINGGQTVTVMINDVIQRMGPVELAEFLRSLRSEDISKIEVIPSPPSEYEASSTGGIVHIILKKARKDGLTGTLSAVYKQQNTKPYFGTGASLDYKMQKLYFFGNVNFSSDQNRYTGYTLVTYPDQSSLYNFTIRNNDNTRYQYRAGVVYDISKAHSINFQAMGMKNILLQNFSSELDYKFVNEEMTGVASSDWRRHPWQGSYTLNYGWKTDSLGSGLRVIADYTTSSKTELNALNSAYSDTARNQYYRTNTPSITHITSLQADYTKMAGKKSALKSGVKYVYTNRDNTILTERHEDDAWAKDAAASNEFRYTERLLMFYGSFETALSKWRLKAGLRGEQTWSKGHSFTSNQSIERNYFGWFPSVFVSHPTNEAKGDAVTLNYARRVRRPGYNDLNPYRLQVHDFTVLTGNPNLLPQYAHSIRGGYTFRHNYSASAYFQTAKNFIGQTARTIDSNIIEYQSKNFPNSTEYGVSLDATFVIWKAWTNRNGLLFYRISNDIDDGRHIQHSFSFQSIQTITWKKVADVDALFYYESPRLDANQRRAEVLYMDTGFTRRILKDRGRLRLLFTDVFNTAREKDLTIYDNTRIDFYQKRPTRTVSLSFNYTFRSGKLFTKKQIQVENSEERSRL